MAAEQPMPLLFLPHRSTHDPRNGRILDTQARAHASKQGHLKSARSKTLKFVPYFSAARAVGSSGPPETRVSPKPGGSSSNNKITSEKTGAYHHHHSSRSEPRPKGVPSRGIGVACWDPFNSLAVPNLEQDEHFMLHYAFSTTWSAFGESERGKRAFAQSWMWRTMENPATLFAQLLGSSTHYILSSSGSRIQSRMITMGLRWKVQAIKALRCEIEKYQVSPDATVTDSALVAVFVLAVHDGFELSPQPEPHPLSPLATYRDMHIYGRMTFGEEHVKALYTLIERRGGFSHIDQHTFGCVMPLLDMLYHSRMGSVPRFPCYRRLQKILRTTLWQPDERASRLLGILGSPFRPGPPDESLLSVIQLNPNLIEVIAVMAELTVAIDHFCRGGSGAPASLDVLANNCDWVSHRLLSTTTYLMSSNDEINTDQQSSHNTGTVMREVCRLSSLIYLDMVIFPNPQHAQIKSRHSATMLPLICGLHQSEWNRDGCVAEFLIWATMLGAIASRFTELHDSYLDLIHAYQVERCSTWDVVELCLRRHLWLDYVCDLPAKTLWSEAR
ncbi:hypothetical protein EDB81DRAFT_686229 [Dactylonectria macrodidyma]|uniref:Uncharacterized protein n=1 Tax=Dactylonectria macrodidyma TaxID=307937 RepID=A0A9P9F5D2_9HYPO|nr:hypothetical protein EDB81DRAFT_686229 [Dactylonectria macrodidyma]